MHLSELDTPYRLSVRSYNHLVRAGYDTVERMMDLDADTLRHIRNIGKKSVDEILSVQERIRENPQVLSGLKTPTKDHQEIIDSLFGNIVAAEYAKCGMLYDGNAAVMIEHIQSVEKAADEDGRIYVIMDSASVVGMKMPFSEAMDAIKAYRSKKKTNDQINVFMGGAKA